MKYFVLKNPKAEEYENVTDYVTIEESVLGKAPVCPVCGSYTGMLPVLPPVVVEIQSQGSQWSDVSFGSGDQILVSDQLKKRFVDYSLLGIESIEPVAIAKAQSRKRMMPNPPKYWICTITHSKISIDDKASNLVRERSWTCPYCKFGGLIESFDRVILEDEDQTSEDIFFARGLPGTLLVSAKFKRVCDEIGLPECYFVESSKYSIR
ncbi:MAG: hypothetical protein F6K19_48300 [Cyanothece sp. SIO1E1]|nr:hypothetical protein [Cyanothece sp. SIO1E1]